LFVCLFVSMDLNIRLKEEEEEAKATF